MKQFILIGLFATVCFSCKSSRYVQPSPYAQGVVASDRFENDSRINQSLFESKDRTISEADIQRLLDGKITIPDSARLALYNFGSGSLNRYYSGYGTNEEFLKARQRFIDTLTYEINQAERVSNVFLMPGILTNANPNLTNLRESAVRLQADMLLIFSIKSDIYYKYKALKKDRAKAFATVETVLLDIRTGVVPFSYITTREQLILKEPMDLDIRETQKRAENEAVVMALAESGKEVVKFLDEWE